MKKFGLGLLIILVIALLFGYYLFKIRKPEIKKQTPIAPTPTVQESSVKDQIILALSQKNNWDISRVELNVATIDGNYAKGDVRFKDEMGGGLWFAAKVGNSWKIVFDGNGIITCDMLVNYQNFPKDLIPQCFDKQTNKIVTR